MPNVEEYELVHPGGAGADGEIACVTAWGIATGDALTDDADRQIASMRAISGEQA